MRRNILNKVFLACMVIAFVSCKSKKLLTVARQKDTTAVKPANTEADLIAAKVTAIRARQVGFNTFSGRASAKLDIDGNSNNVTLNLHIQHDHKIWVSITYLVGIEVARAVITPDSIQVINRLQGVYMRKPFSYVYQYASKQVNYGTLEAILLGNIMPELLNQKPDLKPDNGNIVISGKLQELMYKLLIGPDLKASQTNLDNPAEALTLQVNNSAFIMAGNKVIPSQVDISSAAKTKKIQINLHYTKADFDQPLDYQFVIPSKYTRVD